MNTKLPNPLAHELTNAARLAPFAGAAYGEGHAVWQMEEILSANAGEYRRWSVRHCHGLVATTPQCTIVAIAGTDDPQDWRSNLDCGAYRVGKFRDDHGATINEVNRDVVLHTGFLQVAWLVYRRLRYRWPELHECPEVWIVGHSLGGAAATLLPVLWPCLAPHVVTYGAPRVVHRASPVELSPLNWRSHHRYVAIDDLVPQVPLFYRHTDCPTRILRGYGEVRSKLTWRDWVRRGLRRLWNWRRPLTATLGAHSMKLYRQRLEVLA